VLPPLVTALSFEDPPAHKTREEHFAGLRLIFGSPERKGEAED